MSTNAIFLTETQLADRQQRSIKTLQADRMKGGGIPFVKLGRTVRYRLSDIEAWEEDHLVRSTSEVK
ncbi:helix-turn-helix transcriptional regulator [Devosia sp. XGJD_8]|uniref:helix-turn-helix transcriptional regulator n=1 Tax=Devosia sp. XGJD_8 TaxID=3391187 RepID=UPI0039855220